MNAPESADSPARGEGHACHRCEDWGTLVVLANIGPGVVRETEIDCPEPVHQRAEAS